MLVVVMVDTIVETMVVQDIRANGVLQVRLAVQTVNLLDLSLAVTSTLAFTRLAPYLRIMLLVLDNNDLQFQCRLILKILPDFGRVFIILAVLIFVFAWFGFVIFPPDSEEGTTIFPTFADGAWNLLVLISTANFPDVMMPACEWW